uniref:Uncharacterized protein n=1 Tax=Physarum polycephalum TaxID=5791 RepID=Q9MJ81_PHYPO|nr:hypothetical protein PhpooMp02 [Physarum polycephalum]BAB08081.1 unnamed protein product [Physarum polycephalum]
MITYLLLNSFLLIKLILFILIRIFLIPNIFSKYIIIIFFSIIIYICYKYPRTNILIKEDLFEYALKTTKEKMINICIITLYIFTFVIGIFYLRYINITKKVDLKIYYIMLKNLFTEFTKEEIILNVVIIITFIIIYIFIIYKFTQYFKLQVIKRHLYLIGIPLNNNWYSTVHRKYLWPLANSFLKISIKHKIELLYKKYYFDKKPHKPRPDNFFSLSEEAKILFFKNNPTLPELLFHKYKKMSIFIDNILTKGHYFILIISILYDVINNDFILTTIFQILPWIFFYELFLRISKFVDDIWIPYDQALHNLIYSKKLKYINEETLMIDDEPHDMSFYQDINEHYIKRGFVKDPNNI